MVIYIKMDVPYPSHAHNIHYGRLLTYFDTL